MRKSPETCAARKLKAEVREQLIKLKGDTTLRELGRKMGVDQRGTGNLFEPGRNLTLETLSRMAEALGGEVRVRIIRRRERT